MIIVIQVLMFGQRIVVDMPFLLAFGDDDPVMPFNLLFEIMNVDQLDMKLVFEALYFQENVLIGLATGDLLQLVFVIGELIAKGM